MRTPKLLLVAAATVALTFAGIVPAPGQIAESVAPLSGVSIPDGYRDWKVISVAREEGALDDIRAILGNDMAMRAAQEDTLPFPDGAIVARLAWTLQSSDDNNRAFGRQQSFVAGPPKNGVQFMVKDSVKFASTGGWGFAQFNDRTPATEAVHRGCFGCHQAAAAHDRVFTRYAR